MTLTDIIALAKNGYKPNDIKELLSLAEPEAPKPEEPQESTAKDTEAPEVVTQPEKVEETQKAEPDYKALFEASQAQLAEAQKANINSNMAGKQPDDEKILADMVRNFM